MDRGTWNTPQEIQQELDRRLEVVTPEDQIRGMHFAGVLETVRFLGGEKDVASLRESGDVPKDLDLSELYPVPPFMRLIFAAGHLLAPQLGGFEEVMRQLGVQGTLAFINSMFGDEVRQQVAGPKDLVNMLPDAYRMAITFGELVIEWTGKTQGRVIMRRILTPVAYNEGMLQGALEAVGARDIQVKGVQTSITDSEYTLSWED